MNSLNTKLLGLDIKAFMEYKKYDYFDTKFYNLNIIGIRSNNETITNKFDDALIVVCNSPNGLKTIHYDITTDAGLKSMKQPMSSKGCAILVPGQYRGGWRIGFHQGKYQALVQNKPVKVYRDNNKDNKYDFDPKTIEEGMFGINIHKAGISSIQVDGWSAGCQVFAKQADFNHFMNLCYKQIEQGLGKTFTYTLVNETDIDEFIKRHKRNNH